MNSIERKRAIVEMLDSAKRIGKGQRWVVELSDGKKALLKTSINDNVMVKTDDEAPETAVLSGFTSDVSHVLIANGEIGELKTYLVPIELVEKTFRDCQREWMDADPERRSNTTWVISVSDKFADYAFEISTKPITPDEAKRGLAAHFGTTEDKITISVSM